MAESGERIAHLKVAEFVRLELAVFQADQKSIDRLNLIVHLNEVLGETDRGP